MDSFQIERLENIHNRGIIVQDIQPANIRYKDTVIYLFGKQTFAIINFYAMTAYEFDRFEHGKREG